MNVISKQVRVYYGNNRVLLVVLGRRHSGRLKTQGQRGTGDRARMSFGNTIRLREAMLSTWSCLLFAERLFPVGFVNLRLQEVVEHSMQQGRVCWNIEGRSPASDKRSNQSATLGLLLNCAPALREAVRERGGLNCDDFCRKLGP